jgi:GDP-4-dehydro-6-deoxy-D-mannose reductase
VSVLVTGGGGFAGRHLLRQLLSGSVGRIAATTLGSPPDFAADDPLSGVEWFTMEVGSPDSVAAALRRWDPDQVYHLAGQASVGQSFDAPLETWDVNATGTARVLAALGELPRRPRRILVVSSGEVYGEVAPDRQPIGEDARIQPVTPYGASKAAAEIVALTLGAVSGVEVVIARSFNHIGPGQDDRFVLPSMALQLTRIARGEATPVVRVGNLDVERDFLDVRDVVRGYACLMERGEPGRSYNVCSGRPRSLLSVVQRLAELSETGARLEVDESRVRPVDIPVLVGDPGRLCALGWRPVEPLDKTLRDLLAEARERA